MKKRCYSILCILICLMWFGTPVSAAESLSYDADAFLENEKTQKAGEVARRFLQEEDNNLLEGFDFAELTKQVSAGQNPFSAQKVWQTMWDMLWGGFSAHKDLLLKLCAICLLSTVVMNLYADDGDSQVNRVAFFVFYALCAGLLLTVFSTAYTLILKASNRIQVFLNAMLGALMAVGAAGGNLISAGAFYPVLSGLCSLMGVLLSRLLMPLFCFTSVLTVLNHMSDSFHVKRLCALSDSVMKWVLTFSCLLFVGLLTVKGVVAAPMDALGSKTMKFAVSSFVPVVGGVLSDAVETVAGAGKIIKNSLGAAGIIVVIAMILPTLAELFALVILLKFTAAILECVCDRKLTGVIWDMGSAITMGTSILLVYSVVFILAVASFICVTSFAFGG